MPHINVMTREISFKVVYCGPGLCGKTTNLRYIHEHWNAGHKGKMIELPTETERTLFFDFAPLDFGEIGGLKTRFQLFTVPGQVFYRETRQLVLKGADGIVFVADSQYPRMDSNEEAYYELKEHLQGLGRTLEDFPLVVQYNKRDLPAVATVEELRELVNKSGVPDFEAVASTGQNVFETFKALVKLVLAELRKKK